MKTLTLTDAELQYIATCIDTHQRTHGIKVSGDVVQILKTLSAAKELEVEDGDRQDETA